ncbi:hypothetical protein EV421DRAFT_1745170 [Armillaria borealis]|uniref:Uncharacterized protein n=1 Tax=Armillaria borealis TaxID=47425 RepID=A0AA39MCG4_9AGAR|nr:hypothetical protein EV421DRAFT_1745170 [Armillaria borealis]
MSSSIEYCCSVTPKPYKAALMPAEITVVYKVLVNKWAFIEKKYVETMERHKEWKVVETKKACEEKLRMSWELKQQEEATEEKKQDDLKKKEEEKDATKKLRKKQKKKEKAVKAIGSGKGGETAAAVELLREERRTDADTKGEQSEALKEKVLQKLKEKQDGKQKTMELTVSTVKKNKKRKRATKSVSVVESDVKEVPGSSEKVKAKISGPMEGEGEFGVNSKWFF